MCSVLAILTAIGIYFGMRDITGQEITGWLCVLGAAPVSYTHLDVYKRQLQLLGHDGNIFSIMGNASTLLKKNKQTADCLLYTSADRQLCFRQLIRFCRKDMENAGADDRRFQTGYRCI